ncbi:hypothetical protein L596_019313 [Steinernema carpocapsae]|uniref:Uncharacterized protein n=1 Tax=Steinernema carpocapsae TaxID=34508 RepID=A0A4U5MQB2_STECR|nr:hypothetical protein L596_019313 [Steinernema carpocapsae]
MGLIVSELSDKYFATWLRCLLSESKTNLRIWDSEECKPIVEKVKARELKTSKKVKRTKEVVFEITDRLEVQLVHSALNSLHL